ncbi:MAG: hypothetical protein DGJ47_000057 [Rickettsiaceae bacterium]
MPSQEFENLTGKILVATPFSMEGMIYNKSLIYMMHHSENGAIGFIFNQGINKLPAEDIFKKYDIERINNLNIDVHIGGPSDIKHGFFLHSSDYCKDVLVHDQFSQLCISSNSQILDDIANNQGPNKTIFVVGYTAWSKNQLEEEIRNNLWIIAQANHDLIFNDTSKDKWEDALNNTGIERESFASHLARS